MKPSQVLNILRGTYCGVCFDSFENFSVPLQEFMSKNSLKNFDSIFKGSSPENSEDSQLSAIKDLLNSILSSQIPEKKIIFCKECKQTIHWACLPNKSYKQPSEVTVFKGVSKLTTFLCCICQLKSTQSMQIKEKKSKINDACMECGQDNGLRLALQGKKRDVLLSQFIHPVCGLFSSVIAPKNLEDFSFYR
jgi:hypothetical protein